MSCGECCKQFWFKIMYLIIVGAIFAAVTVVCWSIYDTTKYMKIDQLDLTNNVSIPIADFNVTDKVFVTSNTLGVPVTEGYPAFNDANKNSVCLIALTEKSSAGPIACSLIKGSVKFAISSTFEWNKTATVTRASAAFMSSDFVSTLNTGVMIGGIAVAVVGAICVFAILFCCTGCCTCCCSKGARVNRVGRPMY